LSAKGYVSRGRDQPFACPIGIAVWLEWRRRNPNAPKVPPEDLNDCTDPDYSLTRYTSIPAMIAMEYEEEAVTDELLTCSPRIFYGLLKTRP